jgi:hypothetical protein
MRVGVILTSTVRTPKQGKADSRTASGLKDLRRLLEGSRLISAPLASCFLALVAPLASLFAADASTRSCAHAARPEWDSSCLWSRPKRSFSSANCEVEFVLHPTAEEVEHERRRNMWSLALCFGSSVLTAPAPPCLVGPLLELSTGFKAPSSSPMATGHQGASWLPRA